MSRGDGNAPSPGPPRFAAAQALVAEAITAAEAAGIGTETVVSVLLCEALARMVATGGEGWTADLLGRIAVDLRYGRVPGSPVQ
ncbi:hypothetical protein PQJ75_12665 [Rhodoplanes sp. TEM]|uniref:Uncharacterized protein n=1 Tax=Rhodoplanes tepidamans TaxID=200616 RepID=A0ABT5JEM0_RHOTP|nr:MULTISPECIES: hypothetical protein [Rhodoplanes]MDC7788140.1 hypothetical protein [Rhodoplanes tepidamans]MDC7984583.1 hypothetical protein [Rhodoplanes sp. TEM]MDQ0355170.1 hypothetical protein [Rhodoplanes tepidamans]